MTGDIEVQAVEPAVQDLLHMLYLTGPHHGHSLTCEDDTWVCSCGKRVRRGA